MEHSQLSQMVTWLDQARQSDRAAIEQLREQVENLAGSRDETAKYSVELESQLASLQADVERLSHVEGYFERFREQVNALLDKSETQRQQALRDSDQVRQAEIDNVTKVIAEVRKETEKTRRSDEELAARRADIRRVSDDIIRLKQQWEESDKERREWMRSAVFQEEQRRQDAKRVADLQSQVADLLNRMESVLARVQLGEQLTTRFSELKAGFDELRQQQNRDLEQRQFVEAQHERSMKSWSEEVSLFHQRVDDYDNRMEQYAESHQVIKRATDNLHEFQEQIERQQHEVSELQRLAQTHQRTQFEEWQTQEEQRWQKHIADWDRQWNDYDKTLTDLAARIVALEKGFSAGDRRLQLLLQISEEDAQLRAMAASDWQTRFEQVMEEED